MPMDDEDIGAWLNGLALGIQQRGRFGAVVVLAIGGEEGDMYSATSPEMSLRVFQAFLRKALELPVDEVTVEVSSSGKKD